MPDELKSEPPDESDTGGMMDEELSDEELATLQNEFERLGEDYGEIVSTLDEQTLSWRKEKGGARLPLLLNSQEETLRCLDDPDPNIRELGIHLAVDHWSLCHRISERCEEMAVADPSNAVRCMAIGALGRCHRGKKNARVGSIIASVVLDPNSSFEERKSAYLSLVLVEGNNQRYSISQVLLDFPNTIDWVLVNNYLNLSN